MPVRHVRMTDADLAHLVDRGDAEALAVLYDRHAPAALQVATRVLGQPAAAQDVVHDAFLRLWTGSGFDAARGDLRAFLLVAVRNRSIDVLRRDARRAGFPAEACAGLAAPEQVEAEVERRDAGRRVRAALGSLPPAQAQALTLAYGGDLTQTDIARRLRVPLGTVKGRVRLGLERLAAQLEPSPAA
jgi:RNA polymerase sigma-70 factor, ECF subfamily